MMKFVLLVIVIGAAIANPSSNPEYDALWTRFKQVFQKQYQQPSEEESRRLNWESNVKEINHHNLEADIGMHSYTKGLNEYADLTHEEFVKQMNGFRNINATSAGGSEFIMTKNMELPATVDWRQKGFVTPVKNQKKCASGWAFSTTGSLEGQHMKKTGKLVSLSEQNLVDCTGPDGNQGCLGGNVVMSFTYIAAKKGIDTEASYPYTAQDGTCKFGEKNKNVGATCTGFVQMLSDEKALQQAVATIGPISVVIDANNKHFHLYQNGIFDEPSCSPTSLTHPLLAVGYGAEDGADYWLVKNSWGSSWGEKGYVRMSRNKDNQCGIATLPSYPLV